VRYPTSFEGEDRTVEITGEAYFEIAPNPGKPFFVKVGNETIQVLGTSFNVSAYPDEAGIQTTLLTGALRVRTPRAEVKLSPEEQAQTTAGDQLTVVKNAEAADVPSWKDGFFYFGRASFAAMMRQLARWYDVEVVYQGKVPEMEFGGKVDRSLPLSDLLKFLDKNQIHFRLEGRQLIVLPN
jgi:transmembrane sensor